MKGLIINDLLIIKKQLKAYLIIFLVFLVSSFFLENVIMVMNVFLIMINVAIILGSYTNDATNGWVLYCDASPASRKDYINAKYYFALIMLLSIYLIFILLGFINPNVRKIGYGKYIFANIIILSGALIVLSLSFPLIFKLKVNTGKYVIAFICGILTSLGTLNAISMQFAEPSVLVAVLAILAAAVSFFFSAKLSQKIYKKKEL